MIWTQVPSRSLAWEAKRLTQPGGLVRLRRLTGRGRWSSGVSFFLLAYRPHEKGTFGVTGAWSSLALQPQRLLDRSTALGGDRSRCGDFARGAEHRRTPDEAWCSRLPTSRGGGGGGQRREGKGVREGKRRLPETGREQGRDEKEGCQRRESGRKRRVVDDAHTKGLCQGRV